MFPIPAFPPYAVQTLHSMEAPTMESITRLWGASHALDVLHGGRGGSNLDEAGSSRYLGRGLAAKAATMAPKRREGAEQRCAREATHTMAWRTLSANNEGKHNIFWTFAKATIFGPESGRAKRYAQRDILNMKASERIMLSMVRCKVCKSWKMSLMNINMKTLKKHWEMCINWNMMKFNNGNEAWRSWKNWSKMKMCPKPLVRAIILKVT